MISFSEYQIQNPIGAEDNLIFRARILWRDIATWIRTYLIYVYFEADPGLQASAKNKLLDLIQEFSNYLKLFFGDKVANDYNIMLSNYILLILDLINAQKNGDTNAINELMMQLTDNIDQRAEFLSKINPFWQKSVLQNHAINFLNLTIKEISSFISGDYTNSTYLFDRILTYSSVIGDYGIEGILNYLKFSAR